MLTISNLTQQINPGFAIQISSLKLREGLHHLIGPNGAGKSTLLDIISGLNPTQNQEISLLNISVSPFNLTDLIDIRRYLTQKQQMHFSLTVKEMLNIAHPLVDLSEPLNNDIILGLDLTHLLDRSVNQLSGGEIQRAQLARVFLNITPLNQYIILLDEPYTGLDIKHKFWLNQYLRTLQHFCCIVISHHEINFALRSHNPCILLHNGSLHALYHKASQIRSKELTTIFGIPDEAITIENQGFKQINGI